MLELCLERVRAGDEVLVGSWLIETGRILAERLRERGVRAVHIVEERDGRTQTRTRAKWAAEVYEFEDGDADVLCARPERLHRACAPSRGASRIGTAGSAGDRRALSLRMALAGSTHGVVAQHTRDVYARTSDQVDEVVNISDGQASGPHEADEEAKPV